MGTYMHILLLQTDNSFYTQKTMAKITYMSFTTASLSVGKARCHATLKYALY